MATDSATVSRSQTTIANYNRFLLLVAGLGGLLYGVDVGIIGGALPYLEATSGLNAGQLSIIVAAVLLGSVLSTLFAGILADAMGRKRLMILSGLTFVISIPMIALSHGYGALFFGRLLQGVSGGLIGIVVPLYLAECLSPATRGRGTGVFQWLLTLGIVSAAVIGIYYSYRVQDVAAAGNAAALFAFKDQAWRRIFWVSLPPGLLFVAGAFLVSESPRWLLQRGRTAAAQAALLRSRTSEQAAVELREMQAIFAGTTGGSKTARTSGDSLLRRKYIIPFVLACVILFCNTATGINSIIGYNTNILLQSGLSDLQAHWGYVIFTAINFVTTIGALALVDRKGRKFLLTLGSAGMIVALFITGILFHRTESTAVDVGPALQKQVSAANDLSLRFDPPTASLLLASQAEQAKGIQVSHSTLTVIYSFGGFTGQTNVARSDDNPATTVTINRRDTVPTNKVEGFFRNPFADVNEAQRAPLRIEKASLAPIPSSGNGWLLACTLYVFMAFYAVGPGVCVWLALSELMPTRIRSNGMSIALVINQLVSTTLAAIFLPIVGKYGYSFMFFLFAGFCVLYFVTAAFFLPETKGRTLEEIEAQFESKAA